ncbi:MAG: hypothetical protein ABIL09_20655, partial [Gemmatimonadota bacterium]
MVEKGSEASKTSKESPARRASRGGGHARHARPDDGHVEDSLGAAPAQLLQPAIPGQVADGAGAAVGGELEQRDPGEVADDVEPGHAALAVSVDLRQPLDAAGRPLAVEPVGVPPDRA